LISPEEEGQQQEEDDIMGIRRQRPMAVFVLFFLVAFGGMCPPTYGGSLGPGGESNPGNAVTGAPAIDNTNKTLTEGITFNQVAFYDVGFNVANSGGTNTFAFTGNVTNSTGTPWTDYHFQLGSGLGANFVPFTGATNLGIDFLSIPAPTSDFMTRGQAPDALSWSGGIVPSGKPVNFGFSFTVPDVPGVNGFEFALRQFPSVGEAAVPEPSAVLLLASGLAALPGLARRQAKRK
jgi:hypothetical protein